VTSLPPPHASGVYQIRCIPTGKIYVGSAVDLFKRWEQHRRTLRKGEHRNRYLQHAWDKYGEKQFVFEILEFVDVSHLLEIEQEWIDSTACVDKSIGFNIRDTAESSGSFNAQIWEGFVDPDENEVTIINLEEFCRKHNLSRAAMWNLTKGNRKLKSHKGWTQKLQDLYRLLQL
jgi:group I intron endonuclease